LFINHRLNHLFIKQKLIQLLIDIGLPEGLVNIVYGDCEVVEAWYEDENVVSVCLVGSTPTAKAIAEGWSRGGVIAMLLGSATNVCVVMEDAQWTCL
jgi:malonate-semialdehyde dehydrogenase (acetylating)/methylmalonate-semialdehyde dehydrogenase